MDLFWKQLFSYMLVVVQAWLVHVINWWVASAVYVCVVDVF